MKYETVIGLEVHVELLTETKLFCGCSAKFGAEANENTCPACVGMPGTPPVINKKAIDLAIAAGIVTDCEIAPVMSFEKKNYFYPDLPTGFQATQFLTPICTNGKVEIETKVEGNDGQESETKKKWITLKQIHIEEDAGKQIHDYDSRCTLVDFNRASVPLIEIVSNPDFRAADEVVAYLEKLKSLLSFAGISDCKMQEGSMRCDVNLSVRESGSGILGTRTEIKNMNSTKAIARAIEFESKRHIRALETGSEELVQETRRWDDDCGETFSMREKEGEGDYRYFPHSEIMPIRIDSAWIERVRESLPESAHEKFERMTKELGLPEYDSNIITGNPNLSLIFDKTLKYFNKPKEVVNWIMGDLLGITKSTNYDEISIDCEKLARIIELVDNKTISRSTGKTLLIKVYEDNIDPDAYVKEKGLGMVSDQGLLESIISEVISANEKTVNEYRAGKEKAFTFFVGQVMKKTAGKAEPKLVSEILLRLLNE